MSGKFAWKRDYYAGALMVLLGVGAAVTGSGYKFGTLARMGPGFMPVVLGVVLAFLGILIATTALGSSEPDNQKFLPENPQWLGWLCILAGPVLFIVVGYYGGMIPAIFACVFVSHSATRRRRINRRSFSRSWSPSSACCCSTILLNIPFPLLRGVNL